MTMAQRQYSKAVSVAAAAMLLLPIASVAQTSAAYDKPHVTGVYWREGAYYAMELTAHNCPPLDLILPRFGGHIDD